MELVKRMASASSANPYFAKDLDKAANANKFIGRGSSASSTNRYMIAAGDLANCGVYIKEDVVFVSVEGARKGRLSLDVDEVLLALHARVTFIADTSYDRARSYNVGERELAEFLIKNDYMEMMPGRWQHRSDLGDVLSDSDARSATHTKGSGFRGLQKR